MYFKFPQNESSMLVTKTGSCFYYKSTYSVCHHNLEKQMRSKIKFYIVILKFTHKTGKVAVKFKEKKNVEKQIFKLTQTVMYIGSDKSNVKTNTLIF